ncbi:MAG: hypothetical protein HKP10_00570 [Kiritimatiellales bacterium]|nr:hypothetical protein [Kiritimatiellales bacterium]
MIIRNLIHIPIILLTICSIVSAAKTGTVLATDLDFGYGYQYPVLLRDATVEFD